VGWASRDRRLWAAPLSRLCPVGTGLSGTRSSGTIQKRRLAPRRFLVSFIRERVFDGSKSSPRSWIAQIAYIVAIDVAAIWIHDLSMLRANLEKTVGTS